MSAYSIQSNVTGLHLGTYEADSREAALDAMARDAGYTDYAHACGNAEPHETEAAAAELTITEIVEMGTDA